MAYVDLLAPRAMRTAAGVEFLLRSPLARSVPLACVSVSVGVDGRDVAADDIRFCVNDRDYALDELPALHDESWFVVDAAGLRVRLAEPREAHDVEVRLAIRPPFVPVGGAHLVRTVQRRRVAVETP
jgi:Domain of unknown function (DUF6379)